MSLLYAFYGDDFTGSTDVIEQLAEGGVPAVLFLRAPDAALRARFPDVRAIGVAGDSRSRSPEWMDAHLPAAYAALRDGAVIHYKTCSTFDSSPGIGSIGRALDIGTAAFGGPAAILVAAPHLGRYLAFGNLFAAAGAEIFRIDRHPTMSRHPVTPMHEADLIRHLAAQTRAGIALVPLDRVQAKQAGAAFDAAKDSDAVMFDGVAMDDLAETGAVLLSRGVRFAVGSSGVTRALVLAWRAAGLIDGGSPSARAGEVARLLVVSGSCSPVTARQIARGVEDGYRPVRADVAALLRGESGEEERLVREAVMAIDAGGRCVIHSAEGPLGDAPAAGDRLGAALGRIAGVVIREAGVRRVLFAGGDTSSHGVAELGIDALTWAAPIERGAPLVRAHAADPAIHGLELVLKGGQMGGEGFFETVRRGTPHG